MQLSSAPRPTARSAAQRVSRVRIEPPSRWRAVDLRELWQYRDLLAFLVWRDVSVRYKQTVLGPLWVVITPIISMIIFSVFLGGLVGIPSDNVPYPLFSFAALVPWTLFANVLTRSANSLVGNSHLITKVYFPRLVIPLSNLFSSAADSALPLVILLGMMVAYGYPLTIRIALLPVFLLLGMLTGVAVGLWLAAWNVRYRDVGFLMPFLTQAWMYATPVVYSSSLIQDERVRFIYSLNPMVTVVDGFRWALLDLGGPPSPVAALSVVLVLLVLVGGLFNFKRTEQSFTDVV